MNNDNDIEESVKIRQKIIDKVRSIYGYKSFEMLNAQQNLFSSYVDKGLYDEETEEKIKHLIRQREKIKLNEADKISKNKEYIVMAKRLLCIVYAEKDTDKNVFESAVNDLIDSAQVLPPDSVAKNTIDLFFSHLAMTSNIYDVDYINDLKKRIELMYSKDSEIIESINYLLAIAYGENGNSEEGAALLLDLYNNSFDKRGPSSKKTLRFMKEYAICISQTGNHQKSKELLQECKEIYENLYGSDESEQYKNLIHSLEVENSILDKSRIL